MEIQEKNSANIEAVKKKKLVLPKMIGIIIFFLIVIIGISLFMFYRMSITNNVKTYRNISWGMTPKEIEALETSYGNTIIDINDDGTWIKYTIYDLIDTKDDTNSIIYTFDSEQGTLSSFIISSSHDGNNLFTAVCADLVEMYGEGKYNATTSNGLRFLNADWNNEHETIESIFFSSLFCNEAYFTFTYNDGIVNDE